MGQLGEDSREKKYYLCPSETIKFLYNELSGIFPRKTLNTQLTIGIWFTTYS